MKLDELIDTEIWLFSPRLFPDTGSAKVMLHGVETGGIWIETRDINETFLEKRQDTISTDTPVVFVAYHMIDAVLAAVPKTLISDKLAQ